MVRCTAALAAMLAVTGMAHAAEIENQPAQARPLASHSLLLDAVNAGPRFVAVGERGHILASLDGQDWVQAEVPTRATLTAVTFADASHGWAVGHDAVIVHTDDGGQSWALQNFEPDLERPFLDVLFLTPERGFAIGAYSLFYETSDGGETWTEHETPVRDDEWHFNAISRLDNGHLVIVGESGTVAVSSDDGVTWTSAPSPYAGSYFDAVPFGEAGVLIIGLRGNAYWTTSTEDIVWTKVQTGTGQTLLGGAALPDGGAVIVGLNGTVLRTVNNGRAMERLPNTVGVSLNSVLVNSGRLLAVGDRGSHIIELR
ncbi:MAG: YCF48-related protein [Abyssibacter sp.]|uniref:WD40/YVTN/BNR-like repeat-containing protein n=1 Tax=Abyssibacter sp. TaxID=2320200 RepID=UPI00321AB150